MMTRRINLILATACLAVIALGIIAFAATGDASTFELTPTTSVIPGESKPTTDQPTDSESTSQPSDGAALYSTHCSSCHGAEGDGGSGGPVANLGLSLTDVIDITANGVPRMPSYADTLTAEEIEAVSRYTLSLGN